jgi:DivIVA domain-containing protein
MSLDRQTIEKRDFPIGRRGYEPEAVDEHLARLADRIESLERQPQRRNPESIATVASQQVAAIVQAAESTAADLERQAADEAERIRREAEAAARSTREEAVEASQEHVGRVSESVAQMLKRVDAMEAELSALVESLRTGANRLQADLTLLEGNMGELAGSSAGRGAPSRADAVAEGARSREVLAPAAPAAAPEPPRAAASEEAAPTAAAPADAPAEKEPTVERPAEAPAGSTDDEDVEGARLIALNMALNGTARDETDRYLAENFDLSDRAALLDEVYASVEG